VGIVDEIRKFITTNYKPAPGQFLRFDQHRLAESLRLVDLAKERGTKNQPASDSTDLDVVEQDIVEGMRQQALEDEQRTQQQLEYYLDRIRLASPAGAGATMRMEAQKAVAELNQAMLEVRAILGPARQNLVDRERDLSLFRAKHRRSSPANPPKSYWLLSFSLLFCLTLEIVVNSSVFSGGSEFGLIGGLILAFFYTVASMGLSFILGYFALTRTSHISWGWKIVGTAASILLVAAIIFVNLLAAHYRLAITSGLTEFEAGARVWPSIRTDLLAFFADTQSIIMVVVSLMIAFITAVEGYIWVDPYPGYHKKDKYARQARSRWIRLLQDQSDALERIYHVRSEKIQAAQIELSQKQAEILQILGHRRGLVRNFNNHLQHIQDVGRYLITTYREANCETRKTPKPKHFSRAWKLDTVQPMEFPSDHELLNTVDFENVGKDLLASSSALNTAHERAVAWIKALASTESAQHADAEYAGSKHNEVRTTNGSSAEDAKTRPTLKVVESRSLEGAKDSEAPHA